MGSLAKTFWPFLINKEKSIHLMYTSAIKLSSLSKFLKFKEHYNCNPSQLRWTHKKANKLQNQWSKPDVITDGQNIRPILVFFLLLFLFIFFD